METSLAKRLWQENYEKEISSKTRNKIRNKITETSEKKEGLTSYAIYDTLITLITNIIL